MIREYFSDLMAYSSGEKGQGDCWVYFSEGKKWNSLGVNLISLFKRLCIIVSSICDDKERVKFDELSFIV
jgi:hypothetical protein